MKESNTLKVRGRFSYQNLFEPKSLNKDGSGEKKYSVTLLIPKNDKQQMNAIKQALDNAKRIYKDDVFGGKIPKNVKTIFHDGDGERPNGGEFGEECKGHIVATFTTKEDFPPGVITGRDKHNATKDEIKSGDYGWVTAEIKAYNANGNKGITGYLKNVFKTKTGEALAGRTSPYDDFGDIEYEEEDEVELDPITGLPIEVDPVTGLPIEDDTEIPF